MDYAVVAQIINTHGINGEVKLMCLMDSPDLLLHYRQFFLETNHAYQPLDIKRSRIHKQMLLVEFETITHIDQADDLKGRYLYVPQEALPALPDGVYYLHQLKDLDVYTDEHEYLGRIDSIIETGARDVYSVMDSDGHEILIPNIDEVVLHVDLDKRRMMVHLLKGLRD